jgi:hypothetical protein
LGPDLGFELVAQEPEFEPFSETLVEVSAREMGTRVHAALETGDWEALRALEQEVSADRFRAEPLIEWAAHSSCMKTGRDPACGDSDEIRRKVWTELAFELPVGEQVLVGSIDRLVREERVNPAGNVTEVLYRLIDFKITARTKSPEELVEAYRTQMELYAHALRGLVGAREREWRIEPVLVNISPQNIVEVVVPGDFGSATSSGAGLAQRLAAQAALIVNGEAGQPVSGSFCRFCAFNKNCDQALSQAH